MKPSNAWKLFAGTMAAALLFASCGTSKAVPAGNENTAGQKSPQNAQAVNFDPLASSGDQENAALAATYSVASAAELRALKFADGNVAVFLQGYYEPGDGGGGLFYWNESSTLQDNGGTVFKSDHRESGRFIRSCEPTYRNVKWFGAVGSGKKDDTKAIQNAIDSLPQNGGTVVLPGGVYAVSQTIQIGTGNGGETFSTKNAIKLVGQGGGFAVTGESIPTTIVAAKSMARLISVNGRISDVLIQDLCISGNNSAQVCLSMTAFSGLTLCDVRIQQFAKTGLEIIGGDKPVGNYNISNRFENVQVVASRDAVTCLLMDGNYNGGNDTWLTTFSNCSFDTADCKNAYGAIFRFVDSCSFYRCEFGGTGEGTVGILFDATKNKDFPCGMAFYDCSVSNTRVIEDTAHQIRKNYFYGFCTENGEEIPTHNRLIGITDKGATFNMEELSLGGGGNGGSGSSLPAKRGAVDTYTNAPYNHINLAQTKSEIGIHLNAGGVFKGVTVYAPSYDNNIGTLHISIYKWDGSYSKTKAGDALATKSFVNFENNTWLRLELEEGLEAGEYLVVITATTEEGDFGCGVWTKGKTATVETYQDGYLADFGIWGQLLIE